MSDREALLRAVVEYRDRQLAGLLFVAPDGDDEPTLWFPLDDDRPTALFRRCDVGEAGWAVVHGLLVMARRSPTGSRTLDDARGWLRERVDDGATCPCCGQFAKVYRRKINGTMARALITLYRHAGRTYAHAPSLPGDTHEMSQLSWWGLVEDEGTLRDDGGRAGWWRVTDAGEAFVRDLSTVPKYARIYDHRCLNLVGDPVGIRDALGKRFRYDELMAGV